MDRPRIIRWLRIAVSTICLVMFVGLIWLWVRSYRYKDTFSCVLPNNGYLNITSCVGRIGFGGFELFNEPQQNGFRSQMLSRDEVRLIRQLYDQKSPLKEFYIFGLSIERIAKGNSVATYGNSPHWFLVALSAAFVFVPWLPWHKLRWRFSLRTLLIVTTLVAVVLGLVVWMAR
jgi:hypothetical protein